MHDTKKPHVIRGILAGMAGGLAAAWVMNLFMEGPGQKLQESLQEKAEGQGQQTEDEAPKEDATMKAADAIVSTVTGGRHLSYEQRSTAGPVVHYAFGAIMGGLYGGLAEYSTQVRSGFGTTFGSALFSGADLVAVPGLNLSPPIGNQPKSSLVTPYAAHLVYGVTTELVRRVVRAML